MKLSGIFSIRRRGRKSFTSTTTLGSDDESVRSDSSTREKGKVNPNLSRQDLRKIQRLKSRIVRHNSRDEFRKSKKLRAEIVAIEKAADEAEQYYQLMIQAERSLLGLDLFESESDEQ